MGLNMNYLLSDEEIKHLKRGRTERNAYDIQKTDVGNLLRDVAQAQLSKAEPLIRKDVAREIFEEIEKVGLLPRTGELMMAAGELQEIKTKYGVGE